MAKNILAQAFIYRKDGTPVEISPYLKSIQIDNGDVTGFGSDGFEGVATTATLVLNNAKNVNFSPFSEFGINVSEKITITGNGMNEYPASANIYPETVFTTNSEISAWYNSNTFYLNRILAAGETLDIMYTKYDMTQYNPINRYNNAFNPLLDEMNRIEIYLEAEQIKSKAENITGTVGVRYTLSKAAIADSVYVIDGQDISATLDTATNEVVFNRAITGTIKISYSYYEAEPKLAFSGYISNSVDIADDMSSISLICSDKAYKLQKKYIDNISTNIIRTYAVETLPAETLIQNILTDMFGVGVVPLIVPVASGKEIEITSNDWGGKTVWDCIQGIATMCAWSLKYEYNNTTEDFELTFREPPRDKTTADYEITDAIAIPTNISGTEIYNILYLFYTDAESGTIKNVVVTNSESVSKYGDRVGIITESSTAGINNEADATTLANDIISDICEKVATATLEIPLNLSYNLFDTVKLIYNKYASEPPIFAIESIQHTIDFSTKEFKTIIKGNMTKVRGGSAKWTDMVRRTGKFKQITNRDISSVNLIAKPSALTVVESGLEKIALAMSAYAILKWNRPSGEYPSKYELQLKKSADNWDKAVKYDVASSTVAGVETITQRVKLETATAYKFRVYAVDSNGQKGDVSDEQTINSIGDNVPPAVVSGLSVSAGVKQIIVSFNPNTTDADFLKYRIYYNKGSEPTTATTTFKETTSTKTTIDSLDTDGAYYVRVTAFDTSGNESELSEGNKFATPKLVNDDIFAEIRDKALHIKTNAQMQQWVDSINDKIVLNPAYTNITNLYNKVYIYNTVVDYVLTRGMALQCDDSFTIEGIGKPIIKTQFSNTYNGIDVKSRSLYVKNIQFQNLTTSIDVSFSNVIFARTIDGYFYNLDINNCSFENKSTRPYRVYFENVNLNTSVNLKCSLNLFKDTLFTAFSDYADSNISITDNIFNYTQSPTTLVKVLSIGNYWSMSTISKNTFTNCRIGVTTKGNAAKITGNNFLMTFVPEANTEQEAIYIYSTTSIKQFHVCDNSITVYQDSTTYATGIDLIHSVGDFTYGQVCNNSFFTNNTLKAPLVAWLQSSTYATTGTIIANNTNN